MSEAKASNIVPRLREWQRIYALWQEQYQALHALTKCGPDAPITRAMGEMFDAYTDAVSREVGDLDGWLYWYCWENGMGAKGLTVQSTSGKTIIVTNVSALARVICY